MIRDIIEKRNLYVDLTFFVWKLNFLNVAHCPLKIPIKGLAFIQPVSYNEEKDNLKKSSF